MWRPVVLADPSPKHLTASAQTLGWRKARTVVRTNDWRSALQEFDAALVATPPALRVPTAVELLRAGKHVFMAGRLGASSEAYRQVLAAAAESGTTLFVGPRRRHLHAARWTKALLASRVLGNIHRFVCRESFARGEDASADTMYASEAVDAGVLLQSSPTLDLLLWLLGPISSAGYQDDNRGGVEADCRLDCTLPSGAQGRIEFSRIRKLSNSLRLEGSKGFVEIHLRQNRMLAGSANALAFAHENLTAANMPAQLPNDLLDAELGHFRRGIKSGAGEGAFGTDDMRPIELIERCYRTRRRLKLPWASPASPGLAEVASRLGMSQGASVVITGASGFIGGRLAERLVAEQGARVRCIVRSLANCGRLARLPVDIVKADLSDRQAVADTVRGADYVFHCAYDSRSRAQNLDGTRNLLAAAAGHAVRRFVYVSTFSVYEPLPDGELTEETRDGDRAWIYARNKLDLERMVLDCALSGALPTTVVQPTIVYGPFSKPWTDTPAEMLLYGDVILPNQGEGICNAVYVDDLVDGLIIAALHPAAVGERFIMSGPDDITWAAFFDAFATALGTKHPIYWPSRKIAEANHGLVRNVRLVLKNPKRIAQVAARWTPARRLLQAGLDAMPRSVRTRVDRYYFGRGERRAGEVFLPNPQLLRLYTSKAQVNSEKARRLLGYRPTCDFRRGMDLTSSYLCWAYDDVKRDIRMAFNESPSMELRAPMGTAGAN